MENVKFDHTLDEMHLTLGITQERCNEMIKKFQHIEWELAEPGKDQDEGHLLERFVEVGQTPAEKIFCAFIAGRLAENKYPTPVDDLYDWEE